ncbi:MAG: hypothetical protein ACREHG_10065 [Candidatus Saccharimonadales bacterium]
MGRTVLFLSHGERQDSKKKNPRNTKRGLRFQVKPIIRHLQELMGLRHHQIKVLAAPYDGERFLEVRDLFLEAAEEVGWTVRLISNSLLGGDERYDEESGIYYTRRGEIPGEYIPVCAAMDYPDDPDLPWKTVGRLFLSKTDGDVVIIAGRPFLRLFGQKESTSGKLYEADYEGRCLHELSNPGLV